MTRAASPERPRVAGLIPAAGRSSRMGSDKLTTPVGGRAMLARVAEALIGGGCDPVIVVCRQPGDPRQEAVARLPVRVVYAPQPEAGMGASIAAGADALPADVTGVAICPGDMPLLTAADVAALLRTRAAAPEAVVAAACDGRRGHPVLFPARLLPALRALTGDEGARTLLAGEPVALATVGPGCLVDIDTPADMAALAGSASGLQTD